MNYYNGNVGLLVICSTDTELVPTTLLLHFTNKRLGDYVYYLVQRQRIFTLHVFSRVAVLLPVKFLTTSGEIDVIIEISLLDNTITHAGVYDITRMTVTGKAFNPDTLMYSVTV